MKIGTITEEIKKNDPHIYNEFLQDIAFHIGTMIEQARMSRGMTQAELAKKINTKQPAIARIENGLSLPSLTILDKIAKLGFDSYLIPPRFAFMKIDKVFLDEENNQYVMEGKISATFNITKSPYAPSLVSRVLVLNAENNSSISSNYVNKIK